MLNPTQQAILDQWKDVPIGTPVLFRPHADRPEEIETNTTSAPLEHHFEAYIQLEGIQGFVLLQFVRRP